MPVKNDSPEQAIARGAIARMKKVLDNAPQLSSIHDIALKLSGIELRIAIGVLERFVTASTESTETRE